jgi:hypothetical protein
MSLKAQLLEISKEADRKITLDTERSLLDLAVTSMKDRASRGRKSCTLDISKEFEEGGFLHEMFEIFRENNDVRDTEKDRENALRSLVNRLFRDRDELYGISTAVNGSKLTLIWGDAY